MFSVANQEISQFEAALGICGKVMKLFLQSCKEVSEIKGTKSTFFMTSKREIPMQQQTSGIIINRAIVKSAPMVM